MEELGHFLELILICGDNQGSIFMADNPVTESHSKHINLWWHSIHDYVKEGLIKIFYIEGIKNPYVHEDLVRKLSTTVDNN